MHSLLPALQYSLCLSTKTLFSSSTLLHLSGPKGQCARCSGRSCFNSVWKEQIQGHPLFQFLTTLQSFFQLETLESATQQFSTTLTNQFLSFFLSFFLSLKFRITYHPRALGFLNLFNEVEAIIRHGVNAHLRASYTYLSLGFFFDLHNVARGCLGHFYFPQNSTGAARGSQASLQAQTSAGAVPSPS